MYSSSFLIIIIITQAHTQQLIEQPPNMSALIFLSVRRLLRLGCTLTSRTCNTSFSPTPTFIPLTSPPKDLRAGWASRVQQKKKTQRGKMLMRKNVPEVRNSALVGAGARRCELLSLATCSSASWARVHEESLCEEHDLRPE